MQQRLTTANVAYDVATTVDHLPVNDRAWVIVD